MRDFFDHICNTVEDFIESDDTTTRAIKAGMATSAGAATGAGIVAVSGLTAAGMVGSGTGIGCAAGPVGAVVGGLLGLTAYGVKKTFF